MDDLEAVTTDWYGLYRKGWKGMITDESFAHPAKFARGLIRRIYDHLLEEGCLKACDRILDPFGGVALGGLNAMRLGLHWLGIELEERFHTLGNGNIALWREQYPWFPGTATLLYGDSQKLIKILCGQVEGVITSPPFGEARTGGGIAVKGYRNPELRPGSEDKPVDLVGERSYMLGTQGQADGQLAAMKMDDFDGMISSPAWETTLGRDVVNADARRDYAREKGISNAEFVSPIDMEQVGARDQGYGRAEGQIGNQAGEKFWSAARLIVEQVHTFLVPGAPAVWVVKDFVRNKEIVPFADQWRRLCEAVGFETVHVHRAWLVEERGTQFDLFGEAHTKRVERKSFFRRLAERKGSPRIDWETVLCMRKPGGE